MSRGFRQLMDNLAELAQIPSRITRPVADDINTEIQRQFAEGSDPYGNPWATLAPSTIKKKGHDLIMIESGALQRDTRAVPLAGAGIELVSIEYGQYHQERDGDRPARPVLPNGSDLPLTWQSSIEKNLEAEFKKVMK